MCCSSRSYPNLKLPKLILWGLLLNSVALSHYVCRADSSPALPDVPRPVEWISGPVDASLAEVATVNVPKGFKFTDAKGARILLDSAHARVPAGLAGLMAPVSGDWWITFDYTASGHVATDDQNRLDQDALLKALWPQMASEQKAAGQPALTHINWTLPPSYHAAKQYFDYALKMEGFVPRDQKLAYVARFLGRQGVLQARVIRPWRENEDASLFQQVLADVSFKNGQQYADFKKGDKETAGGLAGLITAGKASAEAAAPATTGVESAMTLKAFWIGFAVIGCVGIAGVALFAKKLRHHKSSPSDTKPARPETSASRPIFNVNGRPKPKAKPVNGNGNGATNGHAKDAKRRRMFNYHKFYTEMMLQGASPAFGETPNGYQNGYENGYNGNGSNGHAPNGLVNVHSEIIATQKSLIEEQKRLIVEQARLIEEKSRLIVEKNQLLDRQSQMIDNNLL